MASIILGRTDCPIGCADPIAHVKLKTDKATEAFPYIHCRGCGCQLHTKNKEQAAFLLAKTAPAKLDAPAVDPDAPAATPPAPPPGAAAPRARFGFGRAAP